MVAVGVAFFAYQSSGSLVLTVLVLAAKRSRRSCSRRSSAGSPGSIPVSSTRSAKESRSSSRAPWPRSAAFGDLTYGLLLLFYLLHGTVSALVAPTWPALIRMVAPDDRLAEFTGLLSGNAAVASILGAVIGGVVVASAGPEWAFLVDALSHVPLIVVLRTIRAEPPPPSVPERTLRTGDRDHRRATSRSAAAFVLAAILNVAAWPVVSALPALADEVDPRAHVLGFLTGAFFAGAAIVAWAVARLRRRYPYGTILWSGFVGAGVMLIVHTVVTYWRDPGLDAVTTAVVTLVPIGLAVSLNAVLLQTLIQLESPPDREGPVLVVYATVTTILAPAGGLLLGAAADASSVYWALGGAGVVMLVVAVALRRRFAMFDAIGAGTPTAEPDPTGHHWALAHLVGPQLLHGALSRLRLHGHVSARVTNVDRNEADAARSVRTARPRYLPASSSSKIAGRSDSGPGARHVALDLARRGEVDELAHVLHGADGGVDDRRVLDEELERVELDVALARGRDARRATNRPRGRSSFRPSSEARHPGGEHEAGIDAAELARTTLEPRRRRSTARVAPSERDEVEPLLADVDADDLVAERAARAAPRSGRGRRRRR